MKIRPVLCLISYALIVIALGMTTGGLWALYFREDIFPFVLGVIVTATCGVAGALFFREKHLDQEIGIREGYAIASLGWIGVSLFSTLPLVFSGHFGFTDAFFEIMSGYTTTGASILTDIESIPKGILFWRSLTHWFGGMGIVVLMVAILPNLALGGMQMLKGELPGPSVDKLGARIKGTAQWLWVVYLALSAAETVLLLLGGMSLFDACNHTFATMATGGFSTKNTSIAFYDSVYIDSVVIFFMFAAGANFTLHYHLIFRRHVTYFKSREFQFYLGLTLLASLAVTLNLFLTDVYESILDAFRYGAFQVVSILTTTGFATADSEQWPAFCKVLLTVLMFVGGCAGSTGGGIKNIRVIILVKVAYRELFRVVHPRMVRSVRVSGEVIDDGLIHAIVGFFVIYIMLFALGSLIIGAFGFDFVTSFEAVAATLNNIGPGFGMVGATGNYSEFPAAAKWLLSFLMLAGRLEILSVLLLFVPEFWKR